MHLNQSKKYGSPPHICLQHVSTSEIKCKTSIASKATSNIDIFVQINQKSMSKSVIESTKLIKPLTIVFNPLLDPWNTNASFYLIVIWSMT